MPATVNQPLPVIRVGEIPSAESAPRWLWKGPQRPLGGVIGAPQTPRPGWADMALSVATGTACSGPVRRPSRGRC
jgi:hypothetical protein